MKARMFVISVSVVGVALFLAWAVAAQGTGVEVNVELPLYAVSAKRAELQPNRPSLVGLDYTSEITFTPAFTAYLPVVFSGYGACRTIPTLISPPNGSKDNNLIPLFRWNNGGDPLATQLHLEIAQDAGFTRRGGCDLSTRGQGVGHWIDEFRCPYNFAPATTYYWRTHLMCGQNIQGHYSQVWSFTTGSGGTILSAPVLIAPANGSAVPSTNAIMQWSSVSGAVEYLVWWKKDDTATNVIFLSGTQMTLSRLSPNTTYEWWVVARNDYAWGNKPVHWTFTTGPSGSSLPPNLSSSSMPDRPADVVIENDDTTIVVEEEGAR
jgi:hypothetical protein